jgi:hypothetical protein
MLLVAIESQKKEHDSNVTFMDILKEVKHMRESQGSELNDIKAQLQTMRPTVEVEEEDMEDDDD